MNWKAFHNRGETLRAVITTASVRRDGILPMDVEGVAETFHDELDLIAALQLKWHTRLAGRIESELAQQPLDLADAVATAWSEVAAEMAGVRLILDHYRAHPVDDAMATALTKADAKEHVFLAVMAGRSSLADEAARRVGADIEARARMLNAGRPIALADTADTADGADKRGFLDRLRAVIAA